MIIPVTISAAVGIAERWSRDEDEKREREKEMLNTELQHLKYQLQPHFFFNSLNTVYALIENSPTLAQETVHNLASLMRYMLYETDQRNVKLSSEVRFMIQYIALMKLRISPRTKITTNFQALGDNYEIVPLLFISLIENAFKHGVSATQPSDIFFKLSVSDDKVCFYAENTNFPKTADDKSGKGIGLINLQKRLQLSYPDKYQFNTWVKDNLFCAQLEITITKKKSGNTATVANEENKLHYS
jgi:LytS/YehU family sensor histidine kinase